MTEVRQRRIKKVLMKQIMKESYGKKKNGGNVSIKRGEIVNTVNIRKSTAETLPYEKNQTKEGRMRKCCCKGETSFIQLSRAEMMKTDKVYSINTILE